MTTAELIESITRPAELAGATLEPGLVPLLLQDAGLTGEPGAQAVPAGALPPGLPRPAGYLAPPRGGAR